MKNFLKKIGNFFYTIYFYVGAFVYIILYGMLFVIPKAKIIKHFKSIEASNKYLRNRINSFGKNSFKLMGSRVKIEGKENIPNSGPYVIIANHQSEFDIPLVLGYVNTCGFIAKAELNKIPGLNLFIDSLGSIFIDRKNPKSGAIALRKFAKALKSDSVIGIFPEGTRTKTGFLNTFKKGSLAVPYRYKTKILPVAINGTYDISNKKSFLLSPAKVELKIFPTVTGENFESEKEFSDHIWNILNNHINQKRKEK